MKITSVNIRRKTNVWTAVLKPLSTVQFSSVREIVPTNQNSCQWTTGGRNVKSQNQWLWRGRRTISLNVSNSSVIRTQLVICRALNLDHLRGTGQQRQLPRSLLLSLLWLFTAHSCSISSERCAYPWRYESNFSLQIFLPCSSYSTLVTHILSRNVTVLDRETSPSHVFVIGIEQRRFSRNDGNSG